MARFGLGFVCALTLLLVLVTPGCRGLIPEAEPPEPVQPFKAVTNRVILVVLENQRFTAIIGNPHAPYLNSLASQYGVAENFFADTHPSIGDYFMLTTGDIISNDLFFSGIVTNDNIARLLGQNSLTWKAYLDSLPKIGYTGDRAYPYAKTHNPFAYFSDIVFLKDQNANLVPFSQFAGDLANDTLPSFVYIAPDQTHNMHDCPDGTRTCDNDTKVAAGDAWLQATLQPVIDSPSFKAHHTLLIIAWDESWDNDSQHGGGHIPVLIVSPDAKPGYVSNTFFQHESILRLMCERLGVPNTLGKAQNAPSMQEFFTKP